MDMEIANFAFDLNLLIKKHLSSLIGYCRIYFFSPRQGRPIQKHLQKSIIDDGNRLPTELFATLEPRNQVIGEFYVIQERHPPDFEAPELRKGRSGYILINRT